MRKKLIGLIFFFNILSCSDYTLINKSEKPFILNSSPSFKGYFYKGSDNYFDYFESRWSFEIDKKFKIPKTHFLIKDRFDKNSNQELKIDIFKTPKVFGILKNDTLYISKNL